MRQLAHIVGLIAVLCTASCSGSSGGSSTMSPDFSGYPETPFTIHDEKDLIGGPTAQGRVGDILLKNDKIRVIIQKPRKNSGVNSFGGNIIDADLVRSEAQAGQDPSTSSGQDPSTSSGQDPSTSSGQDNFGSIFPLVNIEWTVNYYKYEAISSAKDGGTKALRAYGLIDVYDNLDLDFIGDVAEGIAGQPLTFSNRFDDRKNPFSIYSDLKGLSHEVVTDYILEPGKDYVRIETTFTNTGSEDAKFPIGQFINGSGQVAMLIPGLGFNPDLMTQVSANTPAVIYQGFDGVDVSYGYFFKAGQFVDTKKNEPYTTTSVSYSGVTGLLMGEEFLKLAPMGSAGTPEIHFKIPAGQSRTVIGYFIVGNGSAGSVMDVGLAAIGAATRPITGIVKTSGGTPFAGATVAVMSQGQTVVTYRTDAYGKFVGNLPTGGDAESKRFGNGQYTVAVDVPGYHANLTLGAGKCEPKEIDIFTKSGAHIECTLGETGTISLSGPVTDGETKEYIPARLTIVGKDPSPNRVGSAGQFSSTWEGKQPFGIVGVRHITKKGTIDLTGKADFNIEPGTYLIVISHGPEYTSYEQSVTVSAGGSTSIGGVTLNRAVSTPGWVGADLHLHSITSPDSNLSQELRTLAAAAAGLDIMHSSDHDYITDYSSVVGKLSSAGLIGSDDMYTVVGNEITPNHYGHLNAYPLTYDSKDPEGGALDWTDSQREDVSPAPDYIWTLDELTSLIRKDPLKPIIQMDHIMDMPTGLPLACGWVTSVAYLKDFGVAPLSVYADPVERRMPPRTNGTSFPIPYGESGLMTSDFDAIELAIGHDMNDTSTLMRSSLPTWFNLLNLGLIVTATADSDSHDLVYNPVAFPRNYIASSVDPRDGKGSYSEMDIGRYIENIRAHQVTVSGGPIVFIRAKSDSGSSAEIGGTVSGKSISFTVDAKAPSWAWFDTIEVYTNTEPIPIDDSTGEQMKGKAADPATFYKPYHVPQYTYNSVKSFKLSDSTLTGWKEEKGIISATVTFDLDVSEDVWVVAMARGTPATKGYRSLFPIVTNALIDPKDEPQTFDPASLTAFHTDKTVGASAWGFTNPIFIDADGDGKFTAKYVRDGTSPIR